MSIKNDIDKEIQNFLVSSSFENKGAIVKMINKMGNDFISLSHLGDSCSEVL